MPIGIKKDQEMLTDEQLRYLNRIPKDRIINIYPFDPVKVEQISDSVLDRIRSSISEIWRVEFYGSSALGISGQKDIEVMILCPADLFPEYLPALIKEFGNSKPWTKGATSIGWEWEEDGYNVELYLADPDSKSTKEQLKVIEILKENRELLDEYENLKSSFDGKSYRDYQKAKYKFYNRILVK